MHGTHPRRDGARLRCRRRCLLPADRDAVAATAAGAVRRVAVSEGHASFSSTGGAVVVTDRADRPVLFWFRQDLRLADNPGLLAAAEGGTLVLRRGRAAEAIASLGRETGAAAVYWNRCYEPYAIARDKAIKRTLAENGIARRSFNASLLYEPLTVLNKEGSPFAIFAAFWRACLARGAPPAPLPPPRRLVFAPGPASDSLDGWRLAPSQPNWAGGFATRWIPGESGAQQRLANFLDTGARDYAARAACSWPQQTVDKFLLELGWREFAHALLYHHPELPHAPLRTAFARFS